MGDDFAVGCHVLADVAVGVVGGEVECRMENGKWRIGTVVLGDALRDHAAPVVVGVCLMATTATMDSTTGPSCHLTQSQMVFHLR